MNRKINFFKTSTLLFILTHKMSLIGGWMTEKSFAATPFTCHDGILEYIKIMQETIVNYIMAYDKISLNSKDFEGIYAPIYKK